MAQPEIEWVRAYVGNYAVGRAGYKPIALVSHIAEGSLAAVDQHFQTARPGAESSAHFGIGVDGEIHQYVAVEDTAFANGRLLVPNYAAVPWLKGLTINPNRLTISIEWAGKHLRDSNGRVINWWQPTEPQYNAGLALYRYLCERYDIAIDRAHIIRHSDIDSVNKGFCPGLKFPLPDLLGDLGDPAFAKAATPAPAQQGYRIAGPSTVSEPVFRAFLERRNSPLLEDASAADYYHLFDGKGLDANFCLCQMWHESRCGLEDIAAATQNVCNLRPKRNGGIGRAVDVLPTRLGVFRSYDSWWAGALDYADLLVDVYKDMSIDDAIALFAPASDGNAPDHYVAAVLTLMQQLAEASSEGGNQ
jgi:N-acetyl-anhydromuramyl-L-alanine amidase AmpD